MPRHILGPVSKFTVNAVDLSNWVTNVTIEDSADEVESTGFGMSYREYVPGLKDATVTVTFSQDFDASGPDATLAPLYSAGSAGTLKITPQTSGTVVYTMVGKLYSWNPVAGGVGALNSTDATFRNSGTAGLTRGTA